MNRPCGGEGITKLGTPIIHATLGCPTFGTFPKLMTALYIVILYDICKLFCKFSEFSNDI